jgi:arginyl-tRNA synthetase
MIRAIVEETIRSILPGIPVALEYPGDEKNGDYALTSAFMLSRLQKRKPLDIAQEIAARLRAPIFEKVEAVPPGFVNIFLTPEFYWQYIKGFEPGPLRTQDKKRVLIEFVSVNPTGPCNVVSARAAAVGDTLVRIFNFLGDTAHSEFYVCDTGAQIEALGKSLLARVRELQGTPFVKPDDGYVGEYLIPVARAYLDQGGQDDLQHASQFAVDSIVNQQRATLEKFRVVFDHWFYEHSIYEKKLVDRVLEKLREQKLTFEQEGAVWFRATEFGDNRDRVIQTKDGRHTYLLPDIGYHWDKFDRGYDRLLDLFGPDHQGHVPSLKGGIKAVGLPVEKLEVMIVQQVSLVKGEQVLAMSKRAGIYVTLDELMEKVPVDVIRFFFLMRTPSQPLDFDIELALKETEENPVYYAQYAHARIASLLAFAAEQGLKDWSNADLRLLLEPEAVRLMKQVLIFHEVIERCQASLEPHHLVYYLLELANRFHYFYQKHQVVGTDPALSRARLFLVEKVKKVLSRGMSLLGVSSPEKM